MIIEDTIKQSKPFDSPYQKLIVNILYTNSWVNTIVKDFFIKYGITGKQYNILRILRGAKVPVSTSYIRERLLDKMSDVSRIVDRLHDKNLIIKTACTKDKRLVDVCLSKGGDIILDEINLSMNELESNFKNLNPAEIDALCASLNKLRDYK